MLFNSFQFIFFYIFVLAVFSVLRGTPRKAFLLIASYYFYMCWSTRYICVIWGITFLDYFAGLQIERSETQARRRLYLGLSIAANIGLLFFFKYFNFLSATVNSSFNLLGIHASAPLLKIILPVGISFHTFQALSYTIEVYRRRVPAEHSLLDYALYVAFFPQMVAGPIERPASAFAAVPSRSALSHRTHPFGTAGSTVGIFQEDGDRGFACRNREHRLCEPEELQQHRDLHRDVVLRDPDLLRFFRVLRYRDRPCARHGL